MTSERTTTCVCAREKRLMCTLPLFSNNHGRCQNRALAADRASTRPAALHCEPPVAIPGHPPRLAILSMLDRQSPATATPPRRHATLHGKPSLVPRHPYESRPCRAPCRRRSTTAHRVVSRRTWRRRGAAAAWAWRRRPSARCWSDHAASSPWIPPATRASSPR